MDYLQGGENGSMKLLLATWVNPSKKKGWLIMNMSKQSPRKNKMKNEGVTRANCCALHEAPTWTANLYTTKEIKASQKEEQITRTYKHYNNHDLVSPPSAEEMYNKIRKLKNHQQCWFMLRYIWSWRKCSSTNITQRKRRRNSRGRNWIICPIFKNGNNHDCANTPERGHLFSALNWFGTSAKLL